MLRALGRFEDANALYSEALAVRTAEKNWQSASKNASNLAEATLVLGRIEEALASAKKSVDCARLCDDIGQVIYCLTTLADAQHQAGKTEEAQSSFDEAERIHIECIAGRGHPIPVLYRIPGIRYGEFLLTKGDFDRLIARSQYLAISGRDISDEETAYGEILIAEALAGANPAHRVDALRITKDALTRLRKAASEIFLPRALLARARIYASLHDSDAALRDVDRTLAIARRNNANLFVIDAQIERSRIEVDRGNRDLGGNCLQETRELVEKFGYLRRLCDIADIEKRL
jgi:tetratricopeptide (TPR) repeat protein